MIGKSGRGIITAAQTFSLHPNMHKLKVCATTQLPLLLCSENFYTKQ